MCSCSASSPSAPAKLKSPRNGLFKPFLGLFFLIFSLINRTARGLKMPFWCFKWAAKVHLTVTNPTFPSGIPWNHHPRSDFNFWKTFFFYQHICARFWYPEHFCDVLHWHHQWQVIIALVHSFSSWIFWKEKAGLVKELSWLLTAVYNWFGCLLMPPHYLDDSFAVFFSLLF